MKNHEVPLPDDLQESDWMLSGTKGAFAQLTFDAIQNGRAYYHISARIPPDTWLVSKRSKRRSCPVDDNWFRLMLEKHFPFEVADGIRWVEMK